MSETKMELHSVTLDNPVLIKLGKVTQLMAPTDSKLAKDKVDKTVKPVNFSSPVMVVKESPVKATKLVALKTSKSP